MAKVVAKIAEAVVEDVIGVDIDKCEHENHGHQHDHKHKHHKHNIVSANIKFDMPTNKE